MRVHIYRDENPLNPRDFDNLGTMVCWHKKYKLGDEQPDCDPYSYFIEVLGLEDMEDTVRVRHEQSHAPDPSTADFYKYKTYLKEQEVYMEEWLDKKIETYRMVRFPIYMYDHSGVTISTSPFSCVWDSGQLGYIYCTKETMKEVFDVQVLFKNKIKKAEEILKNEVEEYDKYLTGDVYGFVIKDGEEEVDSCWGFFGHNWDTNGIKEHIPEELQSESLWEYHL